MTYPRPLIAVLEPDRDVAGALKMLARDWGYECLAETDLHRMVAAIGACGRPLSALIADPEAIIAEATPTETVLRDAVDEGVPILITSASAASLAVSDLAMLVKPYDPEVLRRWLSDNALLA